MQRPLTEVADNPRRLFSTRLRTWWQRPWKLSVDSVRKQTQTFSLQTVLKSGIVVTQTLRSAWLETREWNNSYQYHSLWLSCSKISYQLPPISLPDSHRAGEERTYINLRTRLLFSSLFSSLLPQTKRLLLPYFLLFFLSHRLPFPPFPLEVSVIIVQKLHKNSLV